MRLAFFGTPDFAVATLAELVAVGHEIAAVYTRAPKPAGRGQKAVPSSVHRFAERAGLPVRTPASLKGAGETEAFRTLALDAAIVVAYGLILPKAILEAPRLGCINVHASLLPRWRGAAPIQRAILAGDAETGVTIMAMDEGLDTGPMLMAERVPIGPLTTAGELHDTLARLGAALVPRALAALERGAISPVLQPTEGVTYAPKIDKAEARIDWTMTAVEIDRQVRALSLAQGAWFPLVLEGREIRIKVIEALPEAGIRAAPGTLVDDRLGIGCADGVVRLVRIQREGRAAMEAEAFLRGLPLAAGTRLG